MALPLLSLDHAHEVLHLADHAARHRGVGEFLDAADLVQPEPDQGLALAVMAPGRAAGLLDLDRLAACHDRHSDSVPAAKASIRHDLAVDAAAARLQRRHLDVAPLR